MLRAKTKALPVPPADGNGATLAGLRRAWGKQNGMRLLRREHCRRRGRWETWELWRFTPVSPPRSGPRSSYLVLTWWRSGWTVDGPHFAYAEASTYLRLRGAVPRALMPPLLVSGSEGP